MERLYRVNFEEHSNCTIYSHVYYCFAANAKEAITKARDRWDKKAHQFGLHATRSEIQNPDDLSVTSFLNRTTSGYDVVGKYIVTNSLVWRVNGKNIFWG